MEDPEITFLFQFGNLRDTVTVAIPTLNLKSLKDRACDFINTKPPHGYSHTLLTYLKHLLVLLLPLEMLTESALHLMYSSRVRVVVSQSRVKWGTSSAA
ncbi:Protein kinase C-like, phorbol ester/diacylglycerol-binding domain [Sergentomyia squamirostris]